MSVSVCKCVCVCVCVCSVTSNSLQPHGLQPTRILSPQDSSGKNTAVGCHFLFQVIFLPQGSNLYLLHWSADSLPLGHLGSSCPWGSLVTQEGGFLCSWPPLSIHRFYAGTSNQVLGFKQSCNRAHWRTGDCHRVYHNFTHGKTKILYEYKQWHKIKDNIPKVLILLFVELGLVNFISNLKTHFAYFIVKLLIYSFPCSSVFLREPNPLLYIPSVTSY